MSCCRGKRSFDSFESYSSNWGRKPSEECVEIPLTAGSSAHKTFSLPCLKSKSRISLAEKDYDSLQLAFFSLTSHFAKIQFRLRQIIQAQPSERDSLLFELASVAFCGIEEFKCDGLPRMEKDFACLGNIRRRQGKLMQRLREQLGVLSEQTVPAKADSKESEDPPKKKWFEIIRKHKKEDSKKEESKKEETKREGSKKEETKKVHKQESKTKVELQKQKKKVRSQESVMEELSAGEESKKDETKKEETKKKKTKIVETKKNVGKQESKTEIEQQKQTKKDKSYESLMDDSSAGELEFMVKKEYMQ